MTDDASTLIVLPTYNECELLPHIVPAIRAAVPEATVLVVDDNSPDGTGDLANGLAAADANIEVMHRGGKQGLGAAYLAAFKQAVSEWRWKRIVQMDADFSHDPKDIPRLLAALDGGAGLAIGSRYTRGGDTQGWGIGRRFISRGGGLYAQAILGVGIRDLTSGFKAWRAETLAGIDLSAVSAKGYGFQIEMTYRALRAGFRVVEVPITFVDRRVGQSKMSGTIFFEALTLVWGLRARVPRGSLGATTHPPTSSKS
jgi:dolichol-phosphate mannosyltransferase